MPQQQCQGCNKLGARYTDAEFKAEGFKAPKWAQPHDDGSACVCRHVTCNSEKQARRDGGRFFSESKQSWVCVVCSK